MKAFTLICVLAFLSVCPILADDDNSGEEEEEEQEVTVNQHGVEVKKGHDPKDFDLVVWMMMEQSVKEQNSREDVANMYILPRAYNLGLVAFLRTLKKTGLGALLKTEGPFTMFGITDEVFESLPSWAGPVIDDNMRDLINYQIIEKEIRANDINNDMLVETHSGKLMRLNLYYVDGNPVYTAQCIRIVRVEKEAKNGIIHVLDNVMLPPVGSGIDTLIRCPIYQTLINSPARDSFWDVIRSEGPWTVFAPTNKAFRDLPDYIRDHIMNDADKMEQVLAYHIAPGTFCSAGLFTENITTLSGFDLHVSSTLTDGLSVNGARLISPDTSVTNGVVHGIDTVLFPPDFEF